MQNAHKAGFAAVAVVLACTMFVGGCQNKKEGGPPSFMNGTPEVVVATLISQRVPMVTELPGRASAHLVAEIRPQVGGIVTKQYFTEGSEVKAGGLLYQIEPAPYQASYNSAKAALTKAEANLVPIKIKAERYKDLIVIKGVSQQDYDEAFAAFKQAEAEIEVNKAAVETVRINLQNTKVTAPITGRIGKSNITVGALATTNQASPFATIQQLDPIYIDATQSSAKLLKLKRELSTGKMRTGNEQAPVKLLLEDGTEYDLQGRLKFSDVTVDSGTGSYTVRMSFSNPKGILMPGMYVRALVQEGVVQAAILVPQQAVSRDAKGKPYVLIVDQGNKVRQQAITVDRTIGDTWLVSSGLQAGDRVIMEGSQKARPGASVKAIAFEEGLKEDADKAKIGQPAKESEVKGGK